MDSSNQLETHRNTINPSNTNFHINTTNIIKINTPTPTRNMIAVRSKRAIISAQVASPRYAQFSAPV